MCKIYSGTPASIAERIYLPPRSAAPLLLPNLNLGSAFPLKYWLTRRVESCTYNIYIYSLSPSLACLLREGKGRFFPFLSPPAGAGPVYPALPAAAPRKRGRIVNLEDDRAAVTPVNCALNAQLAPADADPLGALRSGPDRARIYLCGIASCRDLRPLDRRVPQWVF